VGELAKHVAKTQTNSCSGTGGVKHDWELKIPNDKSQIPNKFQFPNLNDRNDFVWKLVHWSLFVIWCLVFGASPQLLTH
jgi:hypothetical protein